MYLQKVLSKKVLNPDPYQNVTDPELNLMKIHFRETELRIRVYEASIQALTGSGSTTLVKFGSESYKEIRSIIKRL
jgi:hypothetical protein